MSFLKNTASKAVQAEPCLNKAASKTVPAMVRAIQPLANQSLWAADWCDFNTEVDNVCALAIKNLKGIRFIGSVSGVQFFSEWDMSIRAVRLMLRACPENESERRELLEEVVQLSMTLAQDGGAHVN